MQDPAATVRFASLSRLTRKDLIELRKMAGPVQTKAAGSIIKSAKQPSDDPVLLLKGWAYSSVEVQGGGRQIVKVLLPGDLLGLPSLPFSHSVETIAALTETEVCPIPQMALGHLFESNPRLAALLFLISLEERVVLVDRLAMVGRAETSQRVAALILQLRERLCRSEPSTGLTFSTPLTQSHVADMVGATTVHVSRVVQDLGSEGLLKWDRGRVTIFDLEALKVFANLPERDLIKDPAWLPRR